MALLGLFSKRDKSKSSRSTTPSKSTASEADSTEAEYVLPNARNTPQAHNGFYSNPAASSSKIRLGFGHKKSSPIVMADSPRLQPPLMHSPSSALSEGDLDHLRPPLSKSALFSAYSDPQGAHSTRSLPSKPLHSRNNSRDLAQSVDGHSNNDPPNTEKDRKGRNDKKGGFLAWARGRSKSRPPPPPELTVDLSAESFNLKSFRHVGSDPPAVEVPRPPSALSSPFNTPPVRPRPRGNSVASDTSQRISVAAFREMAARQRPNSPSPVLRPPSRTELSSRYDNSSPSPVAGRRPGIPSPATRSSTALASQSDTTSDEDSDSEESESEESGGSATLRPKRSRTITQRSASKATSELGHRSRTSTATPTRGARSNMGHGNDISTISPAISPPASAPRESRPGSTVSRNRASASMSALQPSAAARRASLRVAARAPIPVSRPSMAQSSSSSSDSDSDDSDNAPLSRLVAPKRPGSAASSATTGSRVRMPAKPLIDITGMNAPTLPPLPSFETSAPSSAPEKQEKTPSSPTSPTSPTSFTSDKPTLADRLARIAQGQKSKENLTGGGSSERRSLDYLNFTNNDKEADEKPAPVPQPTRSQTAPMGSLEPSPVSSSAPMRFSRKFKPNGRSLSSPNAAAPVDLADPKPIHPIPIRERSPPPAFSVTSRPISQTSNPSSPRLSASFNTDSIPTIRAIGVSSPPSSPDRSKMPAPTSALTPRNNPTLRNPPPRISSMNANNVLIPETTKPTAKGFTGGGLLSTPAAVPKDPKSRGTRQRSSTMFDTASPAIASLGDNNSPVYSRSSRNLNTLIPSPSSGVLPPKPFADNATRGNSPGSSTASSSRLPLTPGDGSEIGSGRKMISSDSSASGVSSSIASSPVAPKKGHRKVSSLTFEDSGKDRGRPGAKERVQKETPENEEARRRERRRSEAKAAVELGNIVNGRGPMIADDDDEDAPLSSMPPRMSMMNPMLNFTPPTPMPWQPSNMMSSMSSPSPGMMFPVPPANADAAFLAAHQQAMMIAKQAYQMAVAQQAMAQANEEWERGSTATSAYGGGYGGMSNMSSMGSMGNMGGMGMGMFPGQYGMPGWGGSMMFPNSAQSMYAGSVVGSELGGGWASQSVYGGPGDRSSRMFNNAGGGGGGQANFSSSRSDAFGPTSSRPGARPRTKTAPSDGALPAQHARARGGAPPPSSWKKSPQRGM